MTDAVKPALECEHYRGFGVVCTFCIDYEQALVNTIAELERRVTQAEIELIVFRKGFIYSAKTGSIE